MQFNSLIPELDVSNLEKSLHFYIDLTGFNIEYRRNESKFVFLSLQAPKSCYKKGMAIGLLEYPFGRGLNFQIQVNSINLI